MDKLIGMTDFVLKNYTTKGAVKDLYKRMISFYNYANFLGQILELWMFVPSKLVNGVWVVLEEPKNVFSDSPDKKTSEMYQNSSLFIEYQEAKDRVLFEGFLFYKYDNESFSLDLSDSDGSETFCFMKNETIEDLLTFDYEFKLTPTAKKQIGL